jgi:HAD superfamily hydrolase (TIGR01490 family)
MTKTTWAGDSRPALTLFDLDCTLLPTDSDHAFGEFLVQQGWVDATEFKARNDAFYADYLAERLDMHAYVQFATSAWRHRPVAEANAMRQRFMAEVIEPVLHPAAVSLVAQHREQGDWVALVTATNEFVTRPIADAFGIDRLIATELARDAQGRVTGAIQGTPCYREGKIDRVAAWLATRDARFEDFQTITVYSDSMNDLPLLERATHPVATNPSPSLAATAQARGWRTLYLFT